MGFSGCLTFEECLSEGGSTALSCSGLWATRCTLGWLRTQTARDRPAITLVRFRKTSWNRILTDRLALAPSRIRRCTLPRGMPNVGKPINLAS